jgi:hypothetical protein
MAPKRLSETWGVAHKPPVIDKDKVLFSGFCSFLVGFTHFWGIIDVLPP